MLDMEASPGNVLSISYDSQKSSFANPKYMHNYIICSFVPEKSSRVKKYLTAEKNYNTDGSTRQISSSHTESIESLKPHNLTLRKLHFISFNLSTSKNFTKK